MRQRNGSKQIHLENNDAVSGEEHKILSPPQQPKPPHPTPRSPLFVFTYPSFRHDDLNSEHKGIGIQRAVEAERRTKGTIRGLTLWHRNYFFF